MPKHKTTHKPSHSYKSGEQTETKITGKVEGGKKTMTGPYEKTIPADRTAWHNSPKDK